MDALDELLAEAGSDGQVTLADLHLVPVIDYFSQTPEGQTAMATAANLTRWWEGIKDRPSVVKTRPSLG